MWMLCIVMCNSLDNYGSGCRVCLYFLCRGRVGGYGEGGVKLLRHIIIFLVLEIGSQV